MPGGSFSWVRPSGQTSTSDRRAAQIRRESRDLSGDGSPAAQMVMTMATEQAVFGSERRRQALARATDAFERELAAGGISLDPQSQLALLELVERIEALASDSPVVFVSMSPPDEPLGYGWPAEDLENPLRRDVA